MAEGELERARPVVVLTALPLEHEAVRVHLGNPREVPAEEIRFLVGSVRGVQCPVVLAQTGPGNLAAALCVQRAQDQFSPRAVFFVGVAGSLKAEVRLGDVVVGTKIYAYDGVKYLGDEVLVRPDGGAAPVALEQTARHALQGGAWWVRLPRAGGREAPQVHFKPIASGEAVLSSHSAELKDRLRRNYNDAVAVDMESAGLAAAGTRGGVEVMAIRGISDVTDEHKAAADAAGWQQRAAGHAAAACLEVLAALPADGENEVADDPSATRSHARGAVQHNHAQAGGTVYAVQHGDLNLGPGATER
ncbi:5'-methylthioadenosine/S-adenosylhomocysteine nucleosidase [Streptomyces sp. ODS28]|uniref:5'-methylthioadenosine/S-adenosylhomocysteine nucleosidase family protein n=1 Tax=Streptomyces sp. ODS28 TaxID=3136688 RepID=UPI0031E59AF4